VTLGERKLDVERFRSGIAGSYAVMNLFVQDFLDSHRDDLEIHFSRCALDLPFGIRSKAEGDEEALVALLPLHRGFEVVDVRPPAAPRRFL